MTVLETLNIGWLVVGCFLISVDLAIFQPYLDLEAGDNQSLKIQVARREIEPRSSCSASQELNHSATDAPNWIFMYHLKPHVDFVAKMGSVLCKAKNLPPKWSKVTRSTLYWLELLSYQNFVVKTW